MKLYTFTLLWCTLTLSLVATVSIHAMTSIIQKNKFFTALLKQEIEDNNTANVQELLSKLKGKFDVNSNIGEIRQHPYTFLHIAVRKGNEAIVTAFLEAGAHTNVQDSFGNTPLHDAVQRAQTNIVIIKELIKASSPINAQNHTDDTPLHEAVFRLDIPAVKALLEAPGIDVTLKNNNNRTAFDILTHKVTESPQQQENKQKLIQLLTPFYTTLKGLTLDYIKKHKELFKDKLVILPVELQQMLNT